MRSGRFNSVGCSKWEEGMSEQWFLEERKETASRRVGQFFFTNMNTYS